MLTVALGALGATAAHADKAPPPRPAADGDARDAGATDTKPTDDAAKGTPDATPTAPAPAPTPPSNVRRLADTRPRRLPDGVFSGRLEGAGALSQGSDLRVTIVAGRVTDATLRRPGAQPAFELLPVEAGDSLEIRLQGNAGSEFVRINGAFFDAERGAGRFDGVLGRTKVQGTWILARR